jgi:hypothetical protein
MIFLWIIHQSLVIFRCWKAFWVYFYSENSWRAGPPIGLLLPAPGPRVGTPSPPGAQVMRPPPHVFSLLPRTPVYNSGRQLLYEECRSKSCSKSFVAIALPGPPENVSLWPLSSSTAKPTLPSPSAVSHRPHSACSGYRSPHPPPFRAQDRRALIREELVPRAARSQPRRHSLRPRTPPRRPPSPITFRSRLHVTVCLAGSLTSTSTTPPLTSPASASDWRALSQAAAHGELLSALAVKSVSPLHQRPPRSVPASLHRRLAGDWPPLPPCAMPRHLPCFVCWAGLQCMPTWPWAVRILCKRVVSALCRWAAAWFGPMAVEILSIFWFRFKLLQVVKFVQIWIQLRKVWNNFHWVDLDPF